MHDFQAAVAAGIKLLHTKERFPDEVRGALSSKGFDEETTEQAIEHLKRKGLLSEDRAVASKLRVRSGRAAKGDLGIEAELLAAGATEEAVRNALESYGSEADRAREALAAKFGESPPRAKAARFLQSRGFSQDTIESLVEELLPEGANGDIG